MAGLNDRKSVDIISSALNEEDCVGEFIERVRAVMENEPQYDYRIILHDNGSIDQTWKIMKEKAEINSDLLLIRLARTFSFDSALTCGLDHADADFAVLMTSDLQDPPELIPKMLRMGEKGYDQVLVRITRRKSVPLPRRILSRIFYRISNWITDELIPSDVSDFRLMNRRSYLASRSLRESHRFLRGINAWVGFRSTYLEIERPPRFAGKSKWLDGSLFSILAYASRSILAYSARPLSWVSFSSLLLGIFGLATSPLLYLFWRIWGVPFQGFGLIFSVIYISFSLVLIFISILALYLSLIYEEVKSRPLYIISEVLNTRT